MKSGINRYNSTIRRFVAFALSLTVIFSATVFVNPAVAFAEASNPPVATAKVNAPGGVNLRKTPSTSGKVIKTLNDNTKITITREVFLKKSSTSKKKRWYYVSVSGKNGYIRADLVDNIKYTTVTGKTTDAVNYRVGAGTGMAKKGTLKKGKRVTVQLTATPSDSRTNWYKVKIDDKSYYMSSDYVTITGSDSSTSTTASSSPEKTTASDAGSSETASPEKTPVEKPAPTSDVARALINKATNGGSARYVYTFNSDNCTKIMTVTGYNDVYTPQGMAYRDERFYILFANTDGDRIVSYSRKGTRLNAVSFPSNRGHLNGMTWDPVSKLFYIFKGNQTTIYTWNPETNAFGTAKTPYSSSGIGYDKVNDYLVASSQTGIRVYSSGGKFTHKKLFNRCKHNGTIYIQDCCGYNGIVFHGISGSNKKTINYIDVYRVSDGTYLGSIKESFGEIESAVVDDDGYLLLLINGSGTKKEIWKTPLNVNEL